MSELPQTRRPGRPSLASEDVVLETALRSFAEIGYEGTSVRTLNKELGLSHNSIQQRFGTKEQLWRRVVDHAFGSMVAKLVEPAAGEPVESGEAVESDDGMALLYGMLHRFISVSIDHPLHLALMTREATRRSERLDYIFDTYVGPALVPLQVVLDQLRSTGQIRPVPLRTVFMLVAHGAIAPYSLVGLSERFDDYDGTFDPVEHADAVTHLIVSGLRT